MAPTRSGGYKNYLVSGGPVPRCTIWWRKRKQARLQQKNAIAQVLTESAPADDGCCSSNMQGNDVGQPIPLPIAQAEMACSKCDTSDEDMETSHLHSASYSGAQDFTPPSQNLSDDDNSDGVSGRGSPSYLSGSPDMNNDSDLERGSPSNLSSSPDLNNDDLERGSPSDFSASLEINNDINNERRPPSNNSNGNRFPPLCRCTSKTAGDAMFMLLSIGVRFNLPWDAQIAILQMISILFEEADIPTTEYMYMKHVHLDQGSVTLHVFCEECGVYLGTKDREGNSALCENCGKNINVLDQSNIFASVSIESQLKIFVQDDTFVDSILNYKFQDRPNSGVYSDVYDGEFYKSLSKNREVLSLPYNFSYSFFTDGIAYGTSSNKTIWPIYLTINEVPYKERSKYLILAAVYVGSKDPCQQVFLQPLIQEANKLSSEGFSWVHDGREVTSRVIPLCCVLDSVARCQVTNYQSFVAKYGCTFCYKKSSRTRTGQRYLVSAPANLRTEETLREDLREVYNRRNMTKESDRVYRGVKGVSPLFFLNYFALTKCVVVDYMHAICLGVVKHHMELLLESTRKKCWKVMDDENFAKKHLVSEIDSRISLIQSNSSIIRELRSMKDIALWKASEFRSWLLFYMVPVLNGLLGDKYLIHFAMLSKATYILLKKSVTDDEIREAHRLFMLYTLFFQQYFGEENMRYNVHLLSHIGMCVRNIGPLWVQNCFMYEAQNRHMRQLCQSPNQVVLQVTKKFLIYKSLPLICSKLVSSDKAAEFSENISTYKNLKTCLRTPQNDVLLGKGDKSTLSQEEIQAFNVEFDEIFSQGTVTSYNRFISKKIIFSTESYCRGKRNNDSCVITNTEKYAMIQKIITVDSGDVVIFAQVIEVSRSPCLANSSVVIDHLFEVVKRDGVICFSPQSIDSPCIFVSLLNDVGYVSKIPFGCTVD